MHEQICRLCLSYMGEDINNLGWLKCPSCGNMIKGSNSMIVAKEILKDVKQEDLSEDLQKNLEELLKRVNLFRQKYGKPMYVNSGLRSADHNAKIGGSKGSAHMTCEAVDFRDNDGKLFEFIKNNPSILEECDLYLEDPRWTPTWIHLQTRKPGSGNRVFLPYRDKPALDETRLLPS